MRAAFQPIKIHQFLCIAMPIAMVLLPVAITYLAIALVLVLPFVVTKEELKKVVLSPYNYPFWAFYLLHLAGMFNTENMAEGYANLMTKLSFLIFPFLFFRPKNENGLYIEKVLIAFVLACFIAIGLGVAYSTRLWLAGHTSFEGFPLFMGRNFSPNLHVGYMAAYYTFACMIVLWLKDSRASNSILKHIPAAFFYSVSAMFLLAVLLTGAKNQTLFLLLLLPAYVLVQMVRIGKKKTGIFMIAGLLVGLLLVSNAFPKITFRFQKAWEEMNTTHIDPNSISSTSVRLLVWESALDVFTKNFNSGVGTGDLKAELQKQYEQNGYMGAYEKRLDAHNQFLNTSVMLGVAGLVCLIWLFVFSLRFALMHNNYLLLGLTLLIAFSGLTESFLEVRSGIIFYLFFATFLNQVYFFHLPDAQLEKERFS